MQNENSGSFEPRSLNHAHTTIWERFLAPIVATPLLLGTGGSHDHYTSYEAQLKALLEDIDGVSLWESVRLLDNGGKLATNSPSGAYIQSIMATAVFFQRFLTSKLDGVGFELRDVAHVLNDEGKEALAYLVTAPNFFASALAYGGRTTPIKNVLAIAVEMNQKAELLANVVSLVDEAKSNTLSEGEVVALREVQAFCASHSLYVRLVSGLLGEPIITEAQGALQGYTSDSGKNSFDSDASVNSNYQSQKRAILGKSDSLDVKEILPDYHRKAFHRTEFDPDLKIVSDPNKKVVIDVTKGEPKHVSTIDSVLEYAVGRYLYDTTVEERLYNLQKTLDEVSGVKIDSRAKENPHFLRAKALLKGIVEDHIMQIKNVHQTLVWLESYRRYLHRSSYLLAAQALDISGFKGAGVDLSGIEGYPRLVGSGFWSVEPDYIPGLRNEFAKVKPLHDALKPYMDEVSQWLALKPGMVQLQRTGIVLNNTTTYKNLLINAPRETHTLQMIGQRATVPVSCLPSDVTKLNEGANRQDAMTVTGVCKKTFRTQLSLVNESVSGVRSTTFGDEGVLCDLTDFELANYVSSYGEKKCKVVIRDVSGSGKGGKGKSGDAASYTTHFTTRRLLIYIDHSGYVPIVKIPSKYVIAENYEGKGALLRTTNYVSLDTERATVQILKEHPEYLAQMVPYKLIETMPISWESFLDEHIKPRLQPLVTAFDDGASFTELAILHDPYTDHKGYNIYLSARTLGASPFPDTQLANVLYPALPYHQAVENPPASIEDNGGSIPIHQLPRAVRSAYLKGGSQLQRSDVKQKLDEVVINLVKQGKLSSTLHTSKYVAEQMRSTWCNSPRFLMVDAVLPREAFIDPTVIDENFAVESIAEFRESQFGSAGEVAAFCRLSKMNESLVEVRLFVDLDSVLKSIPNLRASLIEKRETTEEVTRNGGVTKVTTSSGLAIDEMKMRFANPYLNFDFAGLTIFEAIHNVGLFEPMFYLARERRSVFALFDTHVDFVIAFHTYLVQPSASFSDAWQIWLQYTTVMTANLHLLGATTNTPTAALSTTFDGVSVATFEDAFKLEGDTLEAMQIDLRKRYPNVLRDGHVMVGNYKMVLASYQQSWALDYAQVERGVYPQFINSISVAMAEPVNQGAYSSLVEFVASYVDAHLKLTATNAVLNWKEA